ncbi:MAG: hypothetical protein JNL35_14810 [Sphingopyxis sp.]|nr:hypothetical protein [Sphingopyxis sp.]
MASTQPLLIHVDSRGVDDEAREALARSLAAEFNEHEAGVADLARTVAPPGSKGGEWAMTAEVAISLGALASSWAVPALQHWLKRQDGETTLTLKGKNADGEYFEVNVTGAAPDDVFKKLNPFLQQAK